MRILSRVAITFKHPYDKRITYCINPAQKLLLLDAPDWLEKCNLFQWAVSDGSIDVVYTQQKQKELESDPAQNILPTGKKIEDADPEQEKIPAVSVVQEAKEQVKEPVKKTRRKKTEQV